MDYVRKRYGVPAKRGGKILFTGTSDGRAVEGTILSAQNGYLFVEFQVNALVSQRAKIHPTWKVEYL